MILSVYSIPFAMQELIDNWLKTNAFIGVGFVLLFIITAVLSKKKILLKRVKAFHYLLWLLIATYYLHWYGLLLFPIFAFLAQISLIYIPAITLMPALCFACMYPCFVWLGDLGLFVGLILASFAANAIQYLGIDIIGRGHTPLR